MTELQWFSGCVPLIESKKGFDVTDFSDLRFSVERQIQKKDL